MKILRQFVIILLFSFLGEALRALLPFPIPASVYGFVLMLAALGSKKLKVSQVKAASDFFIEIMPVLFIPAGVGLLNSWTDLKEVLLPVSIITIFTTIIVMAMTGKVTQSIIRRENKKHERNA